MTIVWNSLLGDKPDSYERSVVSIEWLATTKINRDNQYIVIYWISFFLSFSNPVQAQDYGEFNDYQSFTDGENHSRHWGFNFSPALTYIDINENNSVNGATPSDRTRNILMYDLKLGHVFRRGFYFGIIYSAETQDINNQGPATSRTSFGLSFGYIRRGWTAFFHYYVHSLQGIESTTATFDEYSKGSGFQFDVAYHFAIGKYFFLGPMLSYRAMAYSEAENATTAVDSDASSAHTVLTPMVSLLVLFYR